MSKKEKSSPAFAQSQKRKNKNVYSILEYVYKLLDIFALTSVRRAEAGDLEPYYSLVKFIVTNAILGVLCFGGWYLRIKYHYNYLLPILQVTDCFQTVSDFVEYLVHAYCVYSRGQLFLVEYFKRYKNIDRILGVKNYLQFKRFIRNYLLFFQMFWVVTHAVDFIGWAEVISIIGSIFWTTSYIFKFARVLIIMELTFHVAVLGCRLRHIGNVLESNYHSFENVSCEAIDPLASEHNLSNVNVQRAVLRSQWGEWPTTPNTRGRAANNNTKLSNDSRLLPRPVPKNNTYTIALSTDQNEDRVRLLSRCYMLLISQSDYLNNAFGLRMLIVLINALAEILRWVNIGHILLFNTQMSSMWSHGLPLLSCVLRTLLGMTLLLGLARYCEQCCRQRERLLRILTHTLLNKSISAHYRSALEEMREVVSGQPLELTAYHVFRIDYPLLQSMVSAIVTYTIILTQMEGH